MNFTDNYIKMAEKAVEVQEGWEPERGDWYRKITPRLTGAPYIRVLGERPTIKAGLGFDVCYIWLPRQDQLQGVLWSGKGNIRAKIKKLNVFTIENLPREAAMYEGAKIVATADVQWSFEELWLAFVMKEKYGKQWSQEEATWDS